MTEPVAPDPVDAPARRLALPEDPNQRALVLGGAALAVLLLLFVASRVLLGGGDSAVDEAIPPGGAQPPGTTAPPTTVAPAETFEIFTTKNPFIPLAGAPGTLTPTPSGGGGGGGVTVITPPSGGGGATATTLGGGRTGTTTAPSGGGGGGGGTTATTRAPSSGGAPSRSTGDNEPRRQQRVALLDVFMENGEVRANVRVNDTVHEVGEGDTFATSYRVMSLDSRTECGRFVFGDDAFRLCRGEETLK